SAVVRQTFGPLRIKGAAELRIFIKIRFFSDTDSRRGKPLSGSPSLVDQRPTLCGRRSLRGWVCMRKLERNRERCYRRCEISNHVVGPVNKRVVTNDNNRAWRRKRKGRVETGQP